MQHIVSGESKYGAQLADALQFYTIFDVGSSTTCYHALSRKILEATNNDRTMPHNANSTSLLRTSAALRKAIILYTKTVLPVRLGSEVSGANASFTTPVRYFASVVVPDIIQKALVVNDASESGAF